MKSVTASFFKRHPLVCARELIGCRFRWDGKSARIVETEAYLSIDDPACHTWSRPSARIFVESHDAGDAYVYLNYGVHWLFNVLVKSDQGSGFVLLRALEPLHESEHSRVAAGPGKLTKYLGIERLAHGQEFLGEFERGMEIGEKTEVCVGPRIGISRGQDLPWRFGDPQSPSLSRRF